MSTSAFDAMQEVSYQIETSWRRSLNFVKVDLSGLSEEEKRDMFECAETSLVYLSSLVQRMRSVTDRLYGVGDD